MKKNRKNIFAIDFNQSEAIEIINKLNSGTDVKWEIACCVAKKSQSRVKDLWRYSKYFLFPFKLFLNRKRIANLITWQQFYGILFAFYCRLFHVKKVSQLVILTFMYSPKKGVIGRLYSWFMHYSVCNKYVDHIVCFSKKEIEWYINEFKLSPDKISFLPVAVRKIPEYDTTISKNKYVFTAGHSGRDLDFVIRSLNNTEFNVVVADNHTNEIPAENIVVDKDSTGDSMFQLMAHSYVVITPLKDKLKSAGHLMSLQAMQMGKPVICTDSAGMRPYLVDGYNGIFIENTKDDLLDALSRLYRNSDLYSRMSINARNTYDYYSYAKFGERLCELNKLIKFLDLN